MSNTDAIQALPKKPLTLRQIAAGVAADVGTVSRALAGERGVGKDRMDQIRAYAKAAGYRPQPLRRKCTDAIGLVIRHLGRDVPNSGHIERMLYLAEVGAAKIGKHLNVHMLRPGVQGDDWPKFITENRVDGILVLGHATAEFYERLNREPVPAVAINDTVENTRIDCVLCDPAPAIHEAVRRLSLLGHRSIGLVVTRREYPTVERRYVAYIEAMKEAGIDPDPMWVLEQVPEGLRGGQQAVRTFVASGNVPTAIIFNDDWVAMGGVCELHRLGIRIPDDVSVVGYDNTSISEELSPSLSSIDNREREIMARAIAMLQDRIVNFDQPPRQEILSSQLVWRESCANRSK